MVTTREIGNGTRKTAYFPNGPEAQTRVKRRFFQLFLNQIRIDLSEGPRGRLVIKKNPGKEHWCPSIGNIFGWKWELKKRLKGPPRPGIGDHCPVRRREVEGGNREGQI